MLRALGTAIGALLGVMLLALGGLGLAIVFLPDLGAVETAQKLLAGALRDVARAGLPGAARLAALPPSPIVSGPIALVGLVLLGAAVRPRARRRRPGKGKPAGEEPVALDRSTRRRIEKQISSLVRQGEHAEAADLCVDAGLLDRAVDLFVKAERFGRAAEIRHDQNRFLESAELHVRAGNIETAGTIFAMQDEHRRAAECYLQIGRRSVAAEMYEKAGEFAQAGECYAKAEFFRHAARAYVRSRQWLKAAQALERVLGDECVSGGQLKRDEDTRKLVLQTAKLYEQAGELEPAESVLERGGCFVPAAEIALHRERFSQAADLFLRARDPVRAAAALRRFGEDKAAARVLAEHHRDQGEQEEAAHCYEESGDYGEAGDIYRKLEQFEKAGECYERFGEPARAAEAFALAESFERAGQSFERAGEFARAAECFARLGDHRRMGELLEAGGQFLRAGEIYHERGLDDEAIKVLQRVEPDADEFARASALLGEIFKAKGKYSLAIKKLRQSVGDAELTRDNLDAVYSLACVYELDEQLREAFDLYEKILAFDYHYADVEKRLERARARLAEAPAPSGLSTPGHTPMSATPGRYQILEELGRGGMGIVYKAHDTVLDRPVAYKVLPDALKENTQALKNFLREAKSAARLNHPNIVTVYDAGEQDGRYYIAMEYVDGTTLKEILRRRGGAISPGGVLHVLAQMCEALAYAHDQKIVHRDVKTANTMWTREKKAKVMDFGLAKVMEEVRNHTTLVSGTPYYMSPEQTLGRNVDHRTDIYSLGVTLFELATGRLPFQEGNVPYHHVHTPAPDPREINAQLPGVLASIISRCLQKDPAERFQTAREILGEAKAVLSRATRPAAG